MIYIAEHPVVVASCVIIVCIVIALLATFKLVPAPMKSIRNWLSDLATPFSSIAKELRRANDLKELELAERLNPLTGEPSPVIPITEKPGKHDTEVTFGSEDESKMTLRERMVAAFNREALEEQDDN